MNITETVLIPVILMFISGSIGFFFDRLKNSANKVKEKDVPKILIPPGAVVKRKFEWKNFKNTAIGVGLGYAIWAIFGSAIIVFIVSQRLHPIVEVPVNNSIATPETSNQDNFLIENIKANLWPEYDRKSMLVIYDIEISPNIELPFDLKLRIPAGVSPSVVAGKISDGLINLSYKEVADGAWNVVTINSTSRFVQVEYYDNRISSQNGKRLFDYVWTGDYSVKSFIIQVQQPKNSTNFETSPKLGLGQVGGDGLTYYSTEIGSLSVNQQLSLVITYLKTTDDLTITSFEIPIKK